MADQTRTLSVRAIMDSGEYARGAAAVAAANKEIAATGKGVQVTFAETESALTKASTGATRIANTYIDGARALSTFQKDLKTLNTLLETGQVSTEQASAAYAGMVQKFGLVADGAHLAGQGVSQLGAIVVSTNDNLRAQATAINAVAASYKAMAAEARAAQAADQAQANFNRSFNIAQPGSNSASASASVFEEQLRQQEELARKQADVARLRAQQEGQNFGADLNSRFGIGNQAASARESAAAFEEAAREADMFAAKATALKAALDPVGASQARLNAEIAEYQVLLSRAEISAQEFAQAEVLARQRHEQFAASMNDSGGQFSGNSQFRRQNLGYQAFDVGQGLASGMPLPMILAQQGPQIAQLYAGAGGLKAALSDVVGIAGGVATAIGPIGLAFAGVATAATAVYFLVRKETKTTDEVLKEHEANIKALGEAYGVAEERVKSYTNADKAMAEAATRSSSIELIEKQKQAILDLSDTFGQIGGGGKGATPNFQMKGGYQDFQAAFNELRKSGDIEKFADTVKRIGEEEGLQKQADRILNATKQSAALNAELEKTERLLRQISNDKGPNGFLLSQGPTNQADMGNLAAFEAQQKVITDRAEQSLRAQLANIVARTPQEKANAARQSASAQYNDSETPEVRAQRIELAGTVALIQAQHELRQAKEDRARQSDAALAAAQNELAMTGKNVDEQNRLRAAYEAEAQIREAASRAHVAADEKEIELARQKAATIADINAKVAAGKLLTDQGYQIEQLQLEANLIGANASERARATAALQAEQQLRQQGIDLLSKEGQQYQQNAVQMAQARLEIDRQNAAYQSAQQAGSSMIDSLVTGSGSLKDRLKQVADQALQWFEQMAVANPLKNQLLGTNLPTLGDLFSGKPQVPGLSSTSTASMTVTAGVVNVTGGTGGLPSLFPSASAPGATTTLGSFLGLGNTNGVRPTLTPGGLVNSPVLAANQNTSMLAYQQAISQIESGSYSGNYSSIGPLTRTGDQAYGRYQVMGANIPSWSQKYYGQQLTPQQFLANPQAQDTVFNGEFGGYVSKYGPSGAASKWFTGSATPTGRADITGTTDNHYVQQFNQNLSKLSSTSNSAAQDVGALGTNSTDASKSIMDVFGANGSLTKTVTPAATNPAGFFPAAPTAPTASFNPLSLLTSLFGLFGFADGTDYSPGGVALVGERGPELVNLPRGSQVVPNHRTRAGNDNGSGKVEHHHNYSITVAGNGDKELMQRMQMAAEQTVKAGIDQYNREALFARIDEYQGDRYARGS